jgi:hypothetical protein
MPMKLPVVGKDSYGYLIDVIITRDVWMHRIDIARAAGKELELTDDYDGRVHRLCGCRLRPPARPPLHARSRRCRGWFLRPGRPR